MNLVDQVPVLIFHLLEGNISQNAGIIDENIYLSEVVNCSFDYFLSEFYWIVVSNCDSSLGLYLVDNLISSIVAVSLTSARSSQIVHNNFGAPRSKEKGILFPNSSSSSSNNDYLAIKS